MKEPLDPMDSALDRLLESERHAEFPAAVLDRAWSKIVLGAPPLALLHPRIAPRTWIASHVAGVAASMFVLGVGTGLGIHSLATKAQSLKTVYVPVPAASSAAPIKELPDPIGTSKESATAPTPVVATGTNHGPRAPAPAPSSLRLERTMVDEARAALASEDPQRALKMLNQYQRRFPRPVFGEEREALAVQALVSLGLRDEASRRAAALRTSSPNSLFLPVVDAALRSNP